MHWHVVWLVSAFTSLLPECWIAKVEWSVQLSGFLQQLCNFFPFSFKQHFRVVMDVMRLKLTTFLTVFLGYMWWWYHHTRLRWKSYGWHCMPGIRNPGTLGRHFYRRLKISQLGNLPKKTTWKAHGAWNQVNLWNKLKVVKLCNTCISHWIWFWTWWRTWGVYCFHFIHRCFLDLIPFLRWNQPSSWQPIRTLLQCSAPERQWWTTNFAGLVFNFLWFGIC